MSKKSLLVALSLALVLAMTVGSIAFASSGINIVVNGEALDAEGARIENGRTIVPLRVVLEATGAVVHWDGATRTIFVSTSQAPALDPVIKVAAEDYFAKVAKDNNLVSPEKVKEMLDADPSSLFILDIRRAADFEAGHIPGAVHSEWGKVGEIMDRLPRNKPIVVACYTGQTAGQTLAALRMAGFTNAKSMTYGMKLGWTEKSKLPAEGKGAVPASSLPVVSSPANKFEEILWQAAKDMFADIAAGNRALISGPDLHKALQENPKAYYVLDIRRAADYAAGHIAGSNHSEWSKVGEILDKLPTNQPIVVGCYSGQTAGQTIGVMRMLGMNVQSLLYGVRDGWVEIDKLPVVTK